ncbi:hypothetical protein [Mycolicibacterium sp.]
MSDEDAWRHAVADSSEFELELATLSHRDALALVGDPEDEPP